MFFLIWVTAAPPSPDKLLCIILCGMTWKLWQQCVFYDPCFGISSDATKPAVRLGGWRDHQSPPGAFRHTQTHVYMQQTLACTTNCGPEDLWCVNNSFFMQGLGKQYLEPIDRYAIYYPICWNASPMVCQEPLAGIWQIWTAQQTHMVNCGR